MLLRFPTICIYSRKACRHIPFFFIRTLCLSQVMEEGFTNHRTSSCPHPHGHVVTPFPFLPPPMGGATVGQWGQLASTEMRLWEQNYVIAPLKFGEHAVNDINRKYCPHSWAPLQGGTGGTRPTQYFYFLTLRIWALHGKNRLQKAFVPLNIRRLAERLPPLAKSHGAAPAPPPSPPGGCCE